MAYVEQILISSTGGTIANVKKISTRVVSGDTGLVTNSVIHGLTTAGGGTYVDVKVNPSGSLAVSSDLTQVNSNTVNTGAGNSGTGTQRVILASDQPVIPVSDNAGSLTVDNNGTFAVQATKAGSWAVNVTGGTIATTNAGTFAVQDSQVLTDNGGFTDGTSKLFASGYIYDEVAGTALSENDAAAARINVNRAQVGVIEDGSTRARYATVTAANALKVDASGVAVPITDNSGSLTVDNGGTFAVQATKAGSWAVNVTGGTIAVTNAGTFLVQDNQVTTDNGSFTDGTTKLFTSGYIYDEVAGTALTENDVAAARVNVNRSQIGVIEDGSTRGRYATVSASNALKIDGSGVTQPVSNAGTFAVQATKAGLWAVSVTGSTIAATQSGTWILGANSGVDIGDVTINNAAGGSAVNIQDGGNSITIDGSLTTVSTVSTITNVVHVDDNAGSLTVDNAGTFAVQATKSGSWAVNVTGGTIVLGAGTAYAGKVRLTDGTTDTDVRDLANSNALNVAIVDGSGDQITSFGGGTQYTEDAAAAANPVGTAPILVRTDTPATQVSNDGDNIAQRGTNYGAAYVQVVNSTGSYVDTFGGGTQYTEDAASASDPVGNAQILVRQDTPATLTTTDGDNVARRGTNYGAAYTQIVTSSGSFVDTFGGGTQYTEDVASAADPVGTQLIARRRDALSTETTTDGDNTAVNSTDKGELYVKHVDAIPVTDNSGSLTVDNAGTFAVQATKSGSWAVNVTGGTITADTELPAAASLADATANPSTTSVGNLNSVFNGTTWDRSRSITSSTIDTSGSTTLTGVQAVGIGPGFNRQINPSNLGTATNSVSVFNVDGASTIRISINTTTTGTFTFEATNDGVNWSTPETFDTATDNRVTATNLTPTIGKSYVINSGSFRAIRLRTVSTLGATMAHFFTGTISGWLYPFIGGDIAHDSVNSNNPIQIGTEAIAHGTNPTAVAAADRTKIYSNRAGIPFVMGGHPNIISAEYFTSGAATDDNILPTIAGGTKYVITSITVTCSNANATSPSVRIGFGTASVPAQGATNADAVSKVILSHPGIAPGSGIVKGNGSGIVGIGGDGEELRITCTTPTTSMIVQVDYYTIES